MIASLRFLQWIPALVILTLVIFLSCWAAGVARPDWFTQFERERADLIAAKDGQVCADLGFAVGSPGRGKCERDLLDVRDDDRRVNTY